MSTKPMAHAALYKRADDETPNLRSMFNRAFHNVFTDYAASDDLQFVKVDILHADKARSRCIEMKGHRILGANRQAILSRVKVSKTGRRTIDEPGGVRMWANPSHSKDAPEKEYDRSFREVRVVLPEGIVLRYGLTSEVDRMPIRILELDRDFFHLLYPLEFMRLARRSIGFSTDRVGGGLF